MGLRGTFTSVNSAADAQLLTLTLCKKSPTDPSSHIVLGQRHAPAGEISPCSESSKTGGQQQYITYLQHRFILHLLPKELEMFDLVLEASLNITATAAEHGHPIPSPPQPQGVLPGRLETMH